MTQRLVTVIWRGADSSESRLKVEFYTDDFQFADLDVWVRTRFGLDATSKLRYLRKGLETEFIPNKTWLTNKDDENPTVLVTAEHKAKPIEPASATAAGQNSWPFALFFFFVIMCITSLGIFSQTPAVLQFLPLQTLCNRLDNFLITQHLLSPSKRGASLEAFIVVICSSTTNLFVRRMMNPESMDSALRKYSADAFFNGLASGVIVFIKYYLYMHLPVDK